MRSSVLAAACCIADALAQTTSDSSAATGTAISAGPIASVLNQTGIISSDLVDAAAAYVAGLANTTQQEIETALAQSEIPLQERLDPEAYYSYGRSPAVYPSPQGAGDGNWASAYSQARDLVAQMTNEEKNSIVIPASNNQGCSGFVAAIPRLNFSGICLNDAESGVRLGVPANVSGYASELSVGASWDTGLAWWRAYYIGREFKALGINVLLGPVVGPLGRVAKGGRNWEGFAADPYLSGALVAPTVDAYQQSVIACAKHFIANEQETNRNPFLQGFLLPLGINLNNSVSSNLDDRTMHELYLWPFYDAVHAGVGSVMASYNRVNNSYATQNSKILNGLLKTELGFEGFVVSDWYGQHTGVASAEAGLDLTMPLGTYWGNNVLANAVNNGSLPSSRLDDMATRILAAWFRYAPFDSPGVSAHNGTDATEAASAQVILQSAIEGQVLVKNTDNALPLNAPKSLSLFGYDAVAGLNNDTSDSLLYSLGLANTRQYENGQGFSGLSNVIFLGSIQIGSIPAIALNGTLISGGGSGSVLPASLVSPYEAIASQAATDGTTLHTDFVSQNPAVPADSDACLVLINAQAAEGSDRSTLADEYSDTLVTNVASQCSNTIVVIHNAGIRLVDSWIENPNVTAAIFAHVPGQESGAALVEVLYGRQSPSGRLPYTVGRNESDYGHLLNPTLPTAQDPQYSQSNFTEGVHIDYRYFIQNNIEPRFAFGYGLTYTTFDYANLTTTLHEDADHCLTPPDADERASEGGLASLYDELVTVTVDVTNSGSAAAAEVAQLYLGIPNSGVERALRGFGKQWLQPGETATFSFALRRRDLSVWDAEAQLWMLQEGDYLVYVGKSVLDIQLNGTLCLDA